MYKLNYAKGLFISFFLLMVMMLPFVLPFCDVSSNSYVAHCPLVQITDVSGYYEFFKQQAPVLPINVGQFIALLTSFFVGVFLFDNNFSFKQNWLILKRRLAFFGFHSKPWDLLRLALARGILHNKLIAGLS